MKKHGTSNNIQRYFVISVIKYFPLRIN
ncbi:hypothetical protein [Glaesserella parasuis]